MREGGERKSEREREGGREGVADEQKAALKKVAGVSGGKDECQMRLKGRVRDHWMGAEIRMFWRLWVSRPSIGR